MFFIKYLVIFLIGLIIFGPVFILFQEAFHADPEIWKHIYENQLAESLKQTFIFALISVLFGSFVGLFLAGSTFFSKLFKNILDLIMGLLIIIPSYVFGFAYLSFLDFSGPFQIALKQFLGNDFFFEPRNILIAGLLFGLSCSPYVYFAVRSAFSFNLNRIYESSLLLGQNHFQSFLKIIIPALTPWILGGSLLIFLEGLSDFGFVDLFGVETLSRNLFKSWTSFFSFGNASRIGLILLAICILSIVLSDKIEKSAVKLGLEKTNADSSTNLIKLPASLKIVISILVLLIFLPIVVLLLNTTKADSSYFPEILKATVSTLYVSILTTFSVSAIMALFFISVTKYKNNLFFKVFNFGYGLPGTLLAVAYFIFANKIFVSVFGFSAPPPMILLILIFTAKFGALIFRQLDSAKRSLNQDILDSASLLGSPFRKIVYIEWPQYRKAFFVGFLLLFLETAKELPATMLTKPSPNPTLAMRIHQYASESDWVTGSAYATSLLLTIFMITGLKLILNYMFERKIL